MSDSGRSVNLPTRLILPIVSGSDGSAAAMSGVDPKDRIVVANMRHGAVVAVEDGAYSNRCHSSKK